MENEKRYLKIETIVAGPSDSDALRLDVSKLCLGIVHHPIRERIGEFAQLEFDRQGTAALSRLVPMFGKSPFQEARPLLDPHLSRSPVFIEQMGGTQFKFIPNGKFPHLTINGRLVEEPAVFDMAELGDEIVIGLANTVLLALFRRAVTQHKANDQHDLVGISHAISTVRSKIALVAQTDVSALILGETGTGKELIAQAIHQSSRRSSNRLVSVNMSAVMPSLAAAELFGVRRGAFTDASADKAGLFEQADRGTLFLDEVGATPIEVQPMLLRVLEDCKVKRLGDEKSKLVDVRILAATDQLDIVNAEKSAFNQPLFRRLEGFSIEVPPLRKRRIDVGLLVDHFMMKGQEHTALIGPTQFAYSNALSFSLHHWPGNVRELRNAVQKLRLGETAIPLRTASEMEAALITQNDQSLRSKAPRRAYRKPADITKSMMFSALNDSDWIIKKAAQSLNVSRTSMYELMRKYRAKRRLTDITDDEILKTTGEVDGGIVRWAAHLRVGHQELRDRISLLNMPSDE